MVDALANGLRRHRNTWTSALVGGLAAIPVALALSWPLGNGLEVPASIVGGLFAGYLHGEGTEGGEAAGVRAGPIAELPTQLLWGLELPRMVGRLLEPKLLSIVALSGTLVLAGLLSAFIGIFGGAAGGWLSTIDVRNPPRRTGKTWENAAIGASLATVIAFAGWGWNLDPSGAPVTMLSTPGIEVWQTTLAWCVAAVLAGGAFAAVLQNEGSKAGSTVGIATGAVFTPIFRVLLASPDAPVETATTPGWVLTPDGPGVLLVGIAGVLFVGTGTLGGGMAGNRW